MYSLKCSRKDFIDIIFKNSEHDKIKTSGDKLIPPNAGELNLYWSDKEQRFPECVVLNSIIEVNDFLAWTSTYFPGYSPITSYTHVLDFGVFQSVFKSLFVKTHDNTCNVIIAMMIAEAHLVQSDNENLSFNDCFNTCSFVFGRSHIPNTEWFSV